MGPSQSPRPNHSLRALRQTLTSPHVPGAQTSRSELAELVNAWVEANTDRPGQLDEGYVAKLERGRVRWPGREYRAGFRAVLGAESDAALGFYPTNRPTVATAPNATTTAPAASSSAGPPSVIAIRAMALGFQTADRQVGGGQLYGTVVRYLREDIAPQLLDPTTTDGAALFAAACSVTEIAGWMAHDTGDDTGARGHFDSAYRLANAAEHHALVGNVCASMSHLAAELAQGADAVRIAEVGLTRTDRTPGTHALTARLHAMRARGLALRGEPEACRAALDRAERVIDHAEDEQPADWIAGFDTASLASETALALRALGDLAEAQRQAERVVRLRSGDRVRSRAFGQLTLAGVLADAGQPDHAAAVGMQVCDVAPSLTSTRVRAKLDQLGAALRPHSKATDVHAFLSRLGTLTPAAVVPAVRGWPV